MIGIELSEKAQDVCKTAQEEGLLIITAGENTLRFYPPLNITRSALKKGIAILNKALLKINNQTQGAQ
jgi:acetylornithine/succinyldiaminopimelate/putrescine aminotransferase